MMNRNRNHRQVERAVGLAKTIMPSDVKERLRATVLADVADRSTSNDVARRHSGLRLALAVAFAFALMSGVAYAVFRSVPGDTLYPIREAVDKIGGAQQTPINEGGGQIIERRLAPQVNPADEVQAIKERREGAERSGNRDSDDGDKAGSSGRPDGESPDVEPDEPRQGRGSIRGAEASRPNQDPSDEVPSSDRKTEAPCLDCDDVEPKDTDRSSPGKRKDARSSASESSECD